MNAWARPADNESGLALSQPPRKPNRFQPQYYGGGLVTFPSPVDEDHAVSFHWMACTKKVARALTRSKRKSWWPIVAQLQAPDFKASGLTIGVVTFNTEQKNLIEDLLDAERRKDP